MSAAQVDGQDALPPLHKYGAQPGEPGEPAGRLAQVPTKPDTLQASHAPPHAVLQQTPSMQNPLAHSLKVEQKAPLAASVGTHTPPTQ